MPKASIITIGDEILIGQIVNTNVAWLSQKLTDFGVIVTKHLSISDKIETVASAIRNELIDSDIVISTGGLGPTADDNTKKAICLAFDDQMVFDEESFENIKRLFELRKRVITERNRQQAMVPSRSIPLKNEYGTAPGILYKESNKIFLALPGVPLEMKAIFENSFKKHLIEYLHQNPGEFVLYKTLNTTGIYESQLADLIGDPDEFLDNNSSLAFLPNYRGVRLRLGTIQPTYEKAKTKIEELSQILETKVGNYLTSQGEFNLAEITAELLNKKNKTVAFAESCTGGYLSKELTDIPGVSVSFMGGIVSYSNEAKVKFLEVNPKTLELYGAVSEQTAREMATNVRKLFETDFGVSITGIAGPTGGTPTKPVGTVFIGISDDSGTQVHEFHFGENRTINRERAVANAFLLLINKLK